MSRAFWLGVAAYLVPSFVIAYPWHLTVFAPAYRELAMYRDDVIVPFGLLSMLMQGAAFPGSILASSPRVGRS